MSRGSRFKILSEKRPIDKLNFLKELPEEYTYCFKTGRTRSKGTGRFTTSQLGFFREPHIKPYVTNKVVSIFYEGNKKRTQWASIRDKRKQEKLERFEKENRRKQLIKEERLLKLFNKGHLITGGKLTKRILSVKRIKNREIRDKWETYQTVNKFIGIIIYLFTPVPV